MFGLRIWKNSVLFTNSYSNYKKVLPLFRDIPVKPFRDQM